jgi:hypothetical protein
LSVRIGCLSLSEVKDIAIQECKISEKSLFFLLRFLHEMGLAMWHETPSSLRDIIIFDPIQYFVIPITTIICKHQSLEEEGDVTWHLLPIHEICRKRYFNDWQIMLRSGLLSETLLNGLLSEYSQKDNIILLMKKYGLLLDLSVVTSSSNPNKDNKSMFLVPALLPTNHKSYALSTPTLASSISNLMNHHFFFAFYIFSLLDEDEILTFETLSVNGFLPNGFFERLLCKMIDFCCLSHCDDNCSTDLSQLTKGLSRNSVMLSYRNQSFQVICHLPGNCLEVIVYGTNPIPIYLILFEMIITICQESYHHLKMMTLLPRKQITTEEEEQKENAENKKRRLSFMKLSSIERYIANHADLQITIHDRISFNRLRNDYNLWLYRYKQSLSLTNYDIFLSYRWNQQDSLLVKSLFHEFSYHHIVNNDSTASSASASNSSSSAAASSSLSSSAVYSPISVFLDHQRLQFGENYRDSFVSALLKSRIVIPVITVEALKKMIFHNPFQEDNLLLEWILILNQHEFITSTAAVSSSSSSSPSSSFEMNTKQKIFPIIFGSYVTDSENSEILSMCSLDFPHSFSLLKPVVSDGGGSKENSLLEYHQVKILDLLKEQSVIPERTLKIAEELLQQKGLELSSKIKSSTIFELIQKLLLFQGIFYVSSSSSDYTFPMKLTDLTKRFGEKIVSSLTHLYDENPFFYQNRLIDNNDYYFYNTSPPSSSLGIEDMKPVIPGDDEQKVDDASLVINDGYISSVMQEAKNLQENHVIVMKFFLFQQYAKKKEFQKAKELKEELTGCSCSFKSKDDYLSFVTSMKEKLKVSEKYLEEQLLSSPDKIDELSECCLLLQEADQWIESVKALVD